MGSVTDLAEVGGDGGRPELDEDDLSGDRDRSRSGETSSGSRKVTVCLVWDRLWETQALIRNPVPSGTPFNNMD